MTLADIEERLEVIRASVRDFEMAHCFEDALFADTLRAIADGADNPAELAAAALKSEDIEFKRYCA